MFVLLAIWSNDKTVQLVYTYFNITAVKVLLSFLFFQTANLVGRGGYIDHSTMRVFDGLTAQVSRTVDTSYDKA